MNDEDRFFAARSCPADGVRIARDVRAGHLGLADEFDNASLGTNAGKERDMVRREMAEPAGGAISLRFVAMLVPFSTVGAPVVDAPWIRAAEMCDRRVMRAQVPTNKLPTRPMVGTMLFALPPFQIILIGPTLCDVSGLIARPPR